MEKLYDVIILGGGPAGLTAGLYAGRAGLRTLLLEKGPDGGQIALTAELENYPGQMLEGETGPASQEVTYVLNTSSKKFHLPDCSGAASISQGNREEFTGTRRELVAQGYEPCGKCRP